jgi:hypothetical protein
MEGWSSVQVKAFLLANHYDEEFAVDLEKKKVDGRVLKLVGSDHSVADMHLILGLQPGSISLNNYMYSIFFISYYGKSVLNCSRSLFCPILVT